MESINMDSIADVVFQLKWNSAHAAHREYYAARGINLWRDWLPENVRQSLIGKHAWEQASVEFAPGELFGSSGGPRKIDRKRFSMAPKAGRFYPKGRLSGIPGVFPQNMQPFRCVGINNGHMEIDMAHPLADYPLTLSMTAGQISDKEIERGGTSVDWVGLLTEGPGMQARWQGTPTDFFSEGAFSRKNEQADNQFYEKPRLVHHLDKTAREMVADVYKRSRQRRYEGTRLDEQLDNAPPADGQTFGCQRVGHEPYRDGAESPTDGLPGSRPECRPAAAL
jgi:hypothetical protein